MIFWAVTLPAETVRAVTAFLIQAIIW
jgi:hypothetical protein